MLQAMHLSALGALAVLAVVLAAAAPASDQAAAPQPLADAGADAAKPPPPYPPCVKVQSQAIFSGSGYDHVVSIENGCERDAECQVSTDVSDETLSVSVPAGESRDLVTYRGSPASEFRATVKCTLKK